MAILAGFSFAVIGVSLRAGTQRGAHLLHLVTVSAVIGTVYFCARFAASGGVPQLSVIVLGLIAGITQYVATRIMDRALKAGPLTPLWCAMMLNFMPVTVYACLALGETLSIWQVGTIVTAVGCVVVAAGMAHEEKAACGSAPLPRQRWVYGGILAVVFICNSFLSIAIKYMAMMPAKGGGTLMSAYSDAFMVVMYASILGLLLVDQLVTKRPMMNPRYVLGFGLVCGMGSVGGVSLLARCAAFPAALVFTVCTIASLLFTSLVATFFLGEKRNLRWYIVVGLAILAVLLAQGDALLKLVWT